MSESIPLLLLSGMAADERLFESQLARFTNLRVVAWAEPRRGESLRAYAARLARHIDPGTPCVVGGASFGGMVALEMARHLDARACVLIGSVRSPSELPWRWQFLRLLAPLGPHRLGVLAGLAARFGSRLLPVGTVRRLRRLSEPRMAFVRWAMCALARWRPSPMARKLRVFQIHGAADRVLPVGRTRPDVVVPAGSHALSLFNPGPVNAFLARVLEEVGTEVQRRER